MSWLRLTITCDADHVHPLSEFLQQFNAASLSFSAATNEPHYGKLSGDPAPWELTSVSALFDVDVDLDILLACLRNRLGNENIVDHKIELLRDEVWTEAHKKNYEPMVFGERFCIYPSWLKSNADCESIIMDPGLAFGTGKHATTALCLSWLAQCGLEGKVVIDYGCGSGILALAAALLGAEQVYAIDIDEQALSATETNAKRNKLSSRLIISSPEQIQLPKADILIANILLNPLQELAPKFSLLVKNDGNIVLSGILAVQVEDCLSTFRRWFRMAEPEFQDEWALLSGTAKIPLNSN